MIAGSVSFDATSHLARSFAAVLTSYRIYGPEHPRATEAQHHFLGQLSKLEEQGLMLLRRGDQLVWEGIPLGNAPVLGNLARTLEAHGCQGVRFERDLEVSSLARFVVWLVRGRAGDPVPECKGIRAIQTTDMPALGTDAGFMARFPEFRTPLVLYEETVRCLAAAMESAAMHGTIDDSGVTETAQKMAQALTTCGPHMLGPVQLLRSDAYTWQHSVNVFLIALSILQPLAKSEDELVGWAQAALLHDIGKSRVPPAILHKKGSLDEVEFKIMRRHPEWGLEILLAHDEIHPIAAEVAYCHHMRDNGIGYPETRLPFVPGPVTAVVQVSDMFEAATAHRPYKEPVSVRDAVRSIRQMPGMGSKEAAVALLVRSITEYPPGSELVLEDEVRAIVVGCREDEIDARLPDGSTITLSPDDPRIVSAITRPGILPNSTEEPAS